jgi:hypothetical protein
VEVSEKNKEGKARVSVNSPNELIRATSDLISIQWFRNRKAADGLILELLANDEARLHVVECKRSISNPERWEHSKHQFDGSLSIARALCGALGLTISDVRLYTALEKDNLGGRSPDPVMLKGEIGGRNVPPAEEAWADWMSGWVELNDYGACPHEKVFLRSDDLGVLRGALRL